MNETDTQTSTGHQKCPNNVWECEKKDFFEINVSLKQISIIYSSFKFNLEKRSLHYTTHLCD